MKNVAELKTQINDQQSKVQSWRVKIDLLLKDVEVYANAEKSARNVKEQYTDLSKSTGGRLDRARILNDIKVVRTPFREK